MTVRKAVETILQILIIFLSAVWIFSIFLQEVSMYSLIPSLSITYVIVHYWEKRLIHKRLRKERSLSQQ